MVKRYYRKKNYYYYRRASKAAFNKIASNYSKAKLDVLKRILLSSEYIRWDNPNSTTVTLHDLINSSPDFQMYRQLYMSMKLTGVVAMVVPMIKTSAYAGIGSYALGLLTDNDGDNFANVVESDKSIILDFQHVGRRYWSFYGGSTGWLDIEKGELFPGKFGINATDLPTAGEAYWTVKFTFYLLMKNKG